MPPGGAAAFAHSLIDRFGSRRVPPALTPAPAGLDVVGGLRAWTVLTTAMGVFGFGLTAALRPLV